MNTQIYHDNTLDVDDCAESMKVCDQIHNSFSSHRRNNNPSLIQEFPRFHYQDLSPDKTYEYIQHKHKEIVGWISSFVFSTVIFLGFTFSILNNLSSVIHVPQLHDDCLSILPSYITMTVFTLVWFICAFAVMTVMILVGAAFTSMQKAMLISWIIWLHLQSANSVMDVFVTLVGALVMVWYVFGKKVTIN